MSFDNAGEKAVGGSVWYDFGHDFSKYGLSGFSVGVWDQQGWGAINPATGTRINDRNELNVWLQYRPTDGLFRGFRLQLQYSDLWQGERSQPATGITRHPRLHHTVPSSDSNSVSPLVEAELSRN